MTGTRQEMDQLYSCVMTPPLLRRASLASVRTESGVSSGYETMTARCWVLPRTETARRASKSERMASFMLEVWLNGSGDGVKAALENMLVQ